MCFRSGAKNKGKGSKAMRIEERRGARGTGGKGSIFRGRRFIGQADPLRDRAETGVVVQGVKIRTVDPEGEFGRVLVGGLVKQADGFLSLSDFCVKFREINRGGITDADGVL